MSRGQQQLTVHEGDRFSVLLGVRRGSDVSYDLLRECASERLLAAVHAALFALVRGRRQPALTLVMSAPRQAARSPHLAVLVKELAGDAVVRAGTDEWMLAERAAVELDLLPSMALARLGDIGEAQAAVTGVCRTRLLSELSAGRELDLPDIVEVARVAWREHTSQMLSEHVQTGGFKAFQRTVGAKNARNLSQCLRRHHPDATPAQSRKIRFQALTAGVFELALAYLAAYSNADNFTLRQVLYVGVRRELGDDDIPLPPLPPR